MFIKEVFDVSKSSTVTPGKAALNWILLGVPVLFIAGFFMHNIYEWSGKSAIAGIFAPVNESTWEHLKLTFWPTLLWWIAGFILFNKDGRISANQWFTSCTVAELVCPVVILCFYYTYTGAFGIDSLILDIFSLFLALTMAQGLAHHFYKYAHLKGYNLYVSFALLILIAITFAVLTFVPPHIPLFKDSTTGKYGILSFLPFK